MVHRSTLGALPDRNHRKILSRWCSRSHRRHRQRTSCPARRLDLQALRLLQLLSSIVDDGSGGVLDLVWVYLDLD
jgi:hypothetical protein